MWFYIEPYVHISIKNNKALLYNTFNGKSVSIDEDEELLNLVKLIDLQENLRVIEISKGILGKKR